MEVGSSLGLTAEDRERIRLAVQTAERRTKAEIVPMIVVRSGLYREVRHWVGLGLALLALTVLLTIESHWLPVGLACFERGLAPAFDAGGLWMWRVAGNFMADDSSVHLSRTDAT